MMQNGYYWYKSHEDDILPWPDFEPVGMWRLVEIQDDDVMLSGSNMYYGPLSDRHGQFVGPLKHPEPDA